MTRSVRFTVILGIVLLALPIQGQTVMEPLTFNFSGLGGIALQPAAIAGSQLSFDLNLFTLQVNAANNYLGFKWGALGKEESTFSNLSTLFKEYASANNKSLMLRTDIVLPLSFMAALSPRDSIAFQVRNRTMVNADNIHPQMAKMFYENLEYAPLYGQAFTAARLNVRAIAFTEIGLTYAREVMQKSNLVVKAGVTAKYLLGHGGAYLAIDNMDFHFNEGSQLNLENVKGEYAMGNNLTAEDIEFGDIVFPKNHGWAIDLGATVEKKIAKEGSGYLWKAGFSLLDLGRISFQNSANTGSFSGQAGDLFEQITEGKEDGDGFFAGLCRGWANTFNVSPSAQERFSISLPLMLSLHGDYRLNAKLFVSAIAMISLVSNNSAHGLHEINRVEAGIRSEGKAASIYLPVALQNSGLEVGTFLRLAIFNIGSSNWLNALLSGNMRKANLYFGLRFPVLKKKHAAKTLDKQFPKSKHQTESK